MSAEHIVNHRAISFLTVSKPGLFTTQKLLAELKGLCVCVFSKAFTDVLLLLHLPNLPFVRTMQMPGWSACGKPSFGVVLQE